MVGIYAHRFDSSYYKGEVAIKTGLFIDGSWVDPIDGGDLIDVIDPTSSYQATGKTITSVSGGNYKDIDIAVKAARKAYKSIWGLKVPGEERGRILNRLADLVEKHVDVLAGLEALNVGKPFLVARQFDLMICVKNLRYFAGWADKIYGKTIETNDKKMVYTRREPWGVGLCRSSKTWQLMTVAKIAPALATGNTVVLKPSELTPLTALYFCDLLSQAGIPPGVVNVVNGFGHSAGSAISTHPNIDKISFTGSILTGRKILKASAETNLKAVTLELGGKSPTIIFEDADLDQAIEWAANGVFFNMGQVCIAGSRIYVQEPIYTKFVQGFTKWTEELSAATGGPFNEGTRHGPQVSKTQFNRVMGYIDSGKSEGAKVHIGGERHGDKGYFIKPTIFLDVKPSMKIMQEEIFGPVCCIVKFKTEEEVVEWANDTTYGLAANVMTQNSARALRMANALEAGTISVNCALAADISVPFGGYKQSGIGREFGQEALDTYTQVKAVHVNLGQVL